MDAYQTDAYQTFRQAQRQRVSDGEILTLLDGCETAKKLLVLVWSQLGDFDTLEYAWWLQREADRLQSQGITMRAVAIGDRNSGKQFCQYTGFPEDRLFLDPDSIDSSIFILAYRSNYLVFLRLRMPGLTYFLCVPEWVVLALCQKFFEGTREIAKLLS
jgi:AhpC/TSA antioxidant enzyme